MDTAYHDLGAGSIPQKPAYRSERLGDKAGKRRVKSIGIF